MGKKRTRPADADPAVDAVDDKMNDDDSSSDEVSPCPLFPFPGRKPHG